MTKEMADEEGPSSSKRPSSVFSPDEGQSTRKRVCSFLSPDALSKIDRKDLSAALLNICSANVKLFPYRLSTCNAATKFGGVTFSKAFCELENLDNCFVLGDVFRRGVTLGIDFLDGKIPEAKHEQILVEKLARFLKMGEMIDLNFNNKTDMTPVLANHLFGKLATSGDFTIDKNCKSKRKGNKCSCGDGSCILTGNYGDTSIGIRGVKFLSGHNFETQKFKRLILDTEVECDQRCVLTLYQGHFGKVKITGNPQIWHGCVDIIVKNDIVIENLEKEPDSPGGNSPVEATTKSNTLCRNPRLVAETIVFSFLQKKRHPELSNFLIPCVGIAERAMLLMFYDSEHDILLESSLIPLACENKFSVEAVLITWLAVNYRFLCTGLTNEMLQYKAGFFEEARERMPVYESELKFQNVAQSFSRKEIVLPVDCSLNAFLLENQKRIVEVTSKWALEDTR